MPEKWRRRLESLALCVVFLGYLFWGAIWDLATRHWPSFLRQYTAPTPDAITSKYDEIYGALAKYKKGRGTRRWLDKGEWRRFGVLDVIFPNPDVDADADDKDTLDIGPIGEPGSGIPSVGFLDCRFDQPTDKGFEGICRTWKEIPESAFLKKPWPGECAWFAVLYDISDDRIDGERKLIPKESDPSCLAQFGTKSVEFVWLPASRSAK